MLHITPFKIQHVLYLLHVTAKALTTCEYVANMWHRSLLV